MSRPSGAEKRIRRAAREVEVNSAGVPDATARPRSIITTRSTGALGLVQLVGGEDHRRPCLAQPRDLLPDGHPPLRIDAGGGFVEEHDLRPPDERESERKPLLLSARQPLPRRRSHRQQLQPLEQVLRALGTPVVRGEELQSLSGAHRRVDTALLEHHTDLVGQLAVVLRPSRIEPEHPHLAALGAPVSFDRLDRAGLARSVAPEECDHLTGFHPQVQVVDRQHFAVSHDQGYDVHGGVARVGHGVRPVAAVVLRNDSGIIRTMDATVPAMAQDHR